MNNVITEITPLSERDCFYLVDRQKESFTYPLHKHDEMELNFIENCSGAKRIVGDSIEVLKNYDLVLLGSGLEHSWEQHECKMDRVHEITIQFSSDLFGKTLLEKNQMSSVRKLFQNAQNGIAFGLPSIMRLYDRINEITRTQPGFYRVLKLFEILYELSLQEDYHLLTSSAFAHVQNVAESRRVKKVEEYIDMHFRDEIRLQSLADIASMTPTAFSRFFKLRTGRSISDYIIDVRLGHAARLLADSTNSIVEICYDCGFNNVSNFNRIFKKKKGCTPSAFRENYRKTKVIV
ncbi:MAG: helix-turn-helix domain-containing protein [Bacteroidaceae bacterium]|nr:helix-turn-helix domain-containing protein [Bacteroidaceae bacterium]